MDLLNMMKMTHSPRVPHIDFDIAALALKNVTEYLPELLDLIRSEPAKLVQTRYGSLASDYKSISLLSYGLGHPMAVVRDNLRKAVHAWLRVFELRGTEPPFPAFILKYNPRLPPGAPNSSVLEPLHAEGEKDFSVTNSHDNYLAVCLALIAGEDELAAQLAAMIWDPPNARYIGPGSFCTEDDQHLAYALRALFQRDIAAVDAVLNRIHAGKADAHIPPQATMIRALAHNDREGLLEGLSQLLAWHRHEAPAKKNRRNPEFFLCIPALGLCRLALRNKLCSLDDLPANEVFLPRELLESQS